MEEEVYSYVPRDIEIYDWYRPYLTNVLKQEPVVMHIKGKHRRSGKTTLAQIISTILVEKHKKRVMLVSNRTSLKEWIRYTKFRDRYSKNRPLPLKQNTFDYVIMDEAHYISEKTIEKLYSNAQVIKVVQQTGNDKTMVN